MSQKYNDLDRGWSWCVLIASFTALFVMGGTSYSVGLIHSTLLERFNESQSSTSWVGALNTALVNLAAPLTGYLIDRYSVRTTVVSGGILISIGYLGSAFAPSLVVTVFTCGIAAGLGGSLIWTSSMIAPGFHFQKYRNLVMGVALSGVALGMFGIAPAMQKGREDYGTSGFFIVLSCITLHVIVCGVAMRPSSLELHTQRQRKKEEYVGQTKQKKSKILAYLNLLTLKPVLCLSMSMFMYCTGTYMILLYLPSFCESQGTTQMQASFVISICGVVSVFGRIAAGIVASCKNCDENWVYGFNMTSTGLASVLFPLFSQTYTGQLIYASCFGFFFGGPYVVITPLNIRYVGISNMAMALGVELCFGGIGTIIGPVLAGFILDKGGTYAQIFVIAGCSILLGAVLGLVTIVFTKCNSCYIEDQSTLKVEFEVKEIVDERLVYEKEENMYEDKL